MSYGLELFCTEVSTAQQNVIAQGYNSCPTERAEQQDIPSTALQLFFTLNPFNKFVVLIT
jgi:hypothetical protein